MNESNEKNINPQAKWNAAHPEKTREYQRKYYANQTPEHKAARAAYIKAWKQAHPEAVKKHSRTQREKMKAAAEKKTNPLYIDED